MRKVFTIEASDLDKEDGAALVYADDSEHFYLEPMALLSWDEYIRLQAVVDAARKVYSLRKLYEPMDCGSDDALSELGNSLRALDGEP